MPRRPRADAARNAERLRDAARAAFARDGVRAPLDRIARDAGVSIGTLYNHFPRREDLLDAVLPDAARAQNERIHLRALSAETPAERFAVYLEEVFLVQATDRLLSDVLAEPDLIPDAAAAACQEVLRLGDDLLAAAHPDVGLTPATLRALLLGNAAVHRGNPPEAWPELLTTITEALVRRRAD